MFNEASAAGNPDGGDRHRMVARTHRVTSMPELASAKKDLTTETTGTTVLVWKYVALARGPVGRH
jgi:hypothetical protein